MIIKERLQKIQSVSLKHGSHKEDSTFCVMEAVAFVAGEKWSDHPECACPIISAFMREWNDSLRTDEDRDRLLKPLIPRLIGTKNKALETKRSLMCADWLIRVHIPAWLRIAGLVSQAQQLENLPEIIGMDQRPSITRLIGAIRRDTYAAWVAGRNAVGVAAGVAAWVAAGVAAGDSLQPTIEKLQASALELVNRMIEATL